MSSQLGSPTCMLDPDNRYVDRVLSTLSSLDGRKLKAISAGTFLYSALLLTEGTGLLLRQRWAEYFTVVVTGSFIPLELYELAVAAGSWGGCGSGSWGGQRPSMGDYVMEMGAPSGAGGAGGRSC